MIHYWPDRKLSAKAQDLVEFDMASIRLLTHGKEPAMWLVSTDQYELNGRIFRDSSSPRLLAYYPDTQTIYANDGCNSCTHSFGGEIPQIEAALLERLARLLKEQS